MPRAAEKTSVTKKRQTAKIPTSKSLASKRTAKKSAR